MSSRALGTLSRRTLPTARSRAPIANRKAYSTSENTRTGTSHAQFYSELVPGMIPIALLGSAVFLGLRLLQSNLSHERYLDEARERVRELEAEIGVLRQQKLVEAQGTEVSPPQADIPRKRGWFW